MGRRLRRTWGWVDADTAAADRSSGPDSSSGDVIPLKSENNFICSFAPVKSGHVTFVTEHSWSLDSATFWRKGIFTMENLDLFYTGRNEKAMKYF